MKPFLIDYTQDKGKTWKEGTVIESIGGIDGIVKLSDDTTKEVKIVDATATKMRVRITKN